MRISDWSSDVCSSDLHVAWVKPTPRFARASKRRSSNLTRVDQQRIVRMVLRVTLAYDRPRSEELTAALQTLMRISCAAFCMQKHDSASDRGRTQLTSTHHSTYRDTPHT